MFIASLSLKPLFTVLAAMNPPMKPPKNDRIRAVPSLSSYTDKKHLIFRIKSTRNMYRTINNSITANRKTSQAMMFDNPIITQGISISKTITAKPFFSFIIYSSPLIQFAMRNCKFIPENNYESTTDLS